MPYTEETLPTLQSPLMTRSFPVNGYSLMKPLKAVISRNPPSPNTWTNYSASSAGAVRRGEECKGDGAGAAPPPEWRLSVFELGCRVPGWV